MLLTVTLTLLTGFSAPAGKLADGALGVVELVEADGALAKVRLRIPRAWREKPGTTLRWGGTVTVADEGGVLFSGPLPTFTVESTCENDGGSWSEPVATLELDLAKLGRPLREPIGSSHVVGLLVLGSGKRPPLAKTPAKNVRLRADLDGDGQPDAELREVKSEAGCGPKLEESDLVVATAKESVSAMCCGP